jgi:hypothetical protein
MNKNRTYVIELLALCVGIIYSPMVFYYYLRHKLSLANEQIELFGIAYSEALQRPKTDGVRFAESTARVMMISLFALGYATNSSFLEVLAASIGFTQVVEWLWRREAAESSRQ